MISGIILEIKFGFFKLDNWKYFISLISTENRKMSLKLMLIIINGFFRLIMLLFFLMVSLAIIIWHICVYSLLGFFAIMVGVLVLFLQETINLQVFGIISAIIGLVGTMLIIYNARKQPFIENQMKVYTKLIDYLMNSIPKSENKELLIFDTELHEYISYSSDKVIELLYWLYSNSKENQNEYQSDKLIKYALFSIAVIRYEIKPKRNIFLSYFSGRRNSSLNNLIYLNKKLEVAELEHEKDGCVDYVNNEKTSEQVIVASETDSGNQKGEAGDSEK